MGNVVIQNPPQYTEQIPKWDRETLADGEAMGQVIEQLANNDAYLKKELERQEHVEPITLTAAGWAEESGLFVQTVAVSGVQENMDLRLVSGLENSADAEERKAYRKAFGIVSGGTGVTGDGIVTFKVDKKPATDLTIGLEGV